MAIPSTVKMHGTLSTKTHSLGQYRYMYFACLYTAFTDVEVEKTLLRPRSFLRWTIIEKCFFFSGSFFLWKHFPNHKTRHFWLKIWDIIWNVSGHFGTFFMQIDFFLLWDNFRDNIFRFGTLFCQFLSKNPMFFCLGRGVFLSQFWAFSTDPYIMRACF